MVGSTGLFSPEINSSTLDDVSIGNTRFGSSAFDTSLRDAVSVGTTLCDSRLRLNDRADWTRVFGAKVSASPVAVVVSARCGRVLRFDALDWTVVVSAVDETKVSVSVVNSLVVSIEAIRVGSVLCCDTVESESTELSSSVDEVNISDEDSICSVLLDSLLWSRAFGLFVVASTFFCVAVFACVVAFLVVVVCLVVVVVDSVVVEVASSLSCAAISCASLYSSSESSQINLPL